MNHPQHYQPLAHALHQPTTTSSPTHLSYKPPPSVYQPPDTGNTDLNREEEEDDDDDPDDADEGLVEEQLNPAGQSNSTATQSCPSTGHAQNVPMTPQQLHDPSQATEGKRRPGRPRGSKNRKPRAVNQPPSRLESQLHQPAAAQHPPPPQINDAQNGQSQQFYEFQWRILNLCAEFYGAAEELVKGTSPLVLAQCYQTGSDVSQDPLKMLTEAKRVCDNLLANPSKFALNTATSVYTSLSSSFQASTTPTAPSVQSGSAGSSATSKASTPMITNPQSFVVSLGAQPAYPHAQYPMFSAAATQYPTHYYPQYSYAPPTAAYYQQPILATSQLQVQPLPSTTTTTVASSPISSTGLLNQGAWSEEETEKLKKLSEESRAYNSVGEIEWDWVVSQYGSSRTRHQILIKATSLGLKESSSRGTKRRREADDEVGPSGSAPPQPPPSNPPSSSATATSPTQSHATPTPINSPALQNQPRPSTSKGSTMSTTPNMPWPMPTVAVNTPSPVMSTSTIVQDQQRTSYYRPRPNQDTTKSRTQHNYMYQPTNGDSATGPRLNQDNGK